MLAGGSAFNHRLHNCVDNRTANEAVDAVDAGNGALNVEDTGNDSLNGHGGLLYTT